VGFQVEAGKASAGWCVRDNMGRFVIAGSSWINGKVSINEAEAMAMFEAMKQLQQRGYTNVVLKQIPKLLKLLSAICILVCQSSVLLLVKLDKCCHYVTTLK
jgi:hypothetical protein